MTDENLPVHVGRTPQEHFRLATDIAGICGTIVKQTAKKIGTRQYVCIEGWQAIAAAHGCVLSIDSVEEDAEGNAIAVASVRRMDDGATLGKAEGFVGIDEKMWASRQRYAKRAMAQTRAMSRAARSAFAHVVVLIDKGLSTTPAEEVPDGGFDDAERMPPPGDPLADADYWQAALDTAFKVRGFDAPQAEVAIAELLKRYKRNSIQEMPLVSRTIILDAIRNGHADKYKTNGKPAEPAVA